jgi:16S rRNA processing protein RimM
MPDTPPAPPVPSSIPEGHLEIGHIRRAHGLRGEVFVQLLSDNPARVQPGTRVRTADRELTVESARVASNGRRVVKFAEIPDRTAAERFANVALYAPPIDDPDALWAHELIGAEVVEVDGTARGRCVSVVANPASDILELESGALVPTVFVVSNQDGVITVDVPDGLFDLA